MERRGRPRKPRELKELHGTFRKDRDNDGRPEYDLIVEVPDCPKYLTTPEAQVIWEDVTDQLIRLGILQRVDLGMLAAYAQELGKYFFYQDWLNRRGQTYTSGDKIVARPEVKIARDALQEAKQIAAQFGFTPASREKINVLLSMQKPKEPEKPADPGTFVWS